MIQARLTELNENEILLYLGYRGQEYPAEMEAQVRRCGEEVLAAAIPRLIWRRMPIDGADFVALSLEGEDVREMFSGCREAVLMAVTLGVGVDRLLAKKSISNVTDAAIMDACASAAIENVADNFETDLRKELEAKNLYLTDRFSPGYGDLPLLSQKKLCAALDAERKIGLTVSSTLLMIPGKSVTAVLGIAGTPKPLRKRGCERCGLFRDCVYRREGRSCS